MKKSLEMEVKVGVFVILGLCLGAVALILVSGSRDLFERKQRFKIALSQVEGISVGSVVKMAGFRIGQVNEMKIRDTGDVEVWILVSRKYGIHIRQDSLAVIGTQGVLGDKYVNISVGTPASEVVKDGAEIHAEHSKDIKDYLSKGDKIIDNLNHSIASLDSILGSFQREGRAENIFRNFNMVSSSMNAATKDLPQSSKELNSSMQRLNSIMAKIDRGDGTLGALVNDQSLYDDLKALLGGANRNKVLKYFIKKSVEESRDASKAEAPGK